MLSGLGLSADASPIQQLSILLCMVKIKKCIHSMHTYYAHTTSQSSQSMDGIFFLVIRSYCTQNPPPPPPPNTSSLHTNTDRNRRFASFDKTPHVLSPLITWHDVSIIYQSVSSYEICIKINTRGVLIKNALQEINNNILLVSTLVNLRILASRTEWIICIQHDVSCYELVRYLQTCMQCLCIPCT